MSWQEGEEPTERVLFGLPYRGTAAQHRRMQAALVKTKTYRDWCTADYLVRNGRFMSTEPAARMICEALTGLDIAMIDEACRVIAAEIGDA